MGMSVSGAGGGRRSRRAPMAEINVTPFVDVMLVLLIIFMVTAPLLVAGVPVNLPESSAKPLEQQNEPIEVAIDQEGAIFIDGEETPPSELAATFAAIAAQDAQSEEKSQILLRGDKEINYGRVVLVMGELNAAGLNQISLITGPITGPITSASSDGAASERAASAPDTARETSVDASIDSNVETAPATSTDSSQSASETLVTDGSSSAE